MEYIIEPLREHAVDVGDLNLDPANANTHPEKNMDAIMASLREFGQRQVILAREGTNTVIAGNGRLMAARALGWEKIACVYVDDDDITAMRYAIADNRTSELSEWDGDILSQLLTTIQGDFGSLEGTGFNTGDLDGLLSELGDAEIDKGKYTTKIEPPIYEPKGKEPQVSELYSPSRAKELLVDIDASSLPDEVKEFLTMAAYRHVVFDYQNIAEFYCHQPEEVRSLMRDSALVVIDFNKAIEDGYIQVNNTIRALVAEEMGESYDG